LGGGGGFPPVTSVFGGAGTAATGAAGGGDDDGAGAAPGATPSAPPTAAALPPAVDRVTGEEGETTVFSAEGVLYEWEGGDVVKTVGAWKERGRGELRLNLPPDAAAGAPQRRPRLVMRSRGHLRLLLNARLWPGIQATRTLDGSKGATFCVVNFAAAGDDAAAPPPAVATYAFRMKAADKVDEFLAAVDAHKGE